MSSVSSQTISRESIDLKKSPAFSLATCLAVWAVGLSGMSAQRSAETLSDYEGIPDFTYTTRAAQKGCMRKDALARDWLNLASSSLAIGRFLERPSIEGASPTGF